MEQLLRLYFDEKKQDQSIAIYLKNQELEYITLFDNIEVFYEGGQYLQITWGSFGYYVRDSLKEMLEKVLQGDLILDESIKKSLGYYQAQDYKKNNRKNLKYVATEAGHRMWVGNYYHLFSSSDSYQQDSWLYNNQDGDIVFEITPSYPWFFTAPREGEIVIKYSEWLKQYRPYVVRKISKEVVQNWITQLDKLVHKVTVNDERLTCQGPECEMCKKEGPPQRW